MARRALLRRSKLSRFSKWLRAPSWTIKKTKGAYEVLRATKPGKNTLIVWTRLGAQEHTVSQGIKEVLASRNNQ